MASAKAWLGAARLRTLPLAFSSILMGSFLASEADGFRLPILALTLLTTLFLQILSNFSNDYGDAIHGVDNDDRVGPARAIQSGEITKVEMKKGMIICGILAFISGVSLLYISEVKSLVFIIFITIGSLAIWAAIGYTAGSKPYGYRALGDLFVFLFFGLVGVLGTTYLHLVEMPLSLTVLPAASIGLLSTAVLNLNNMRDSIPDKAAGKITMAGLMGFKTAKIYHAILLSTALICLSIYVFKDFDSPLQLSFLILGIIFFFHLVRVFKCQVPAALDPELKKVALSTLLVTLIFGLGLILF